MKQTWINNRGMQIAVQGALLYAWLVNLQNTDSYFSVYLLIGVCSVFAMQQNYWNHAPIARNAIRSCVIFGGVFSTAVVLANYSLFSPWSALLSLMNALFTLLGGVVAFGHILTYLLWRLPLKADRGERHYPQKVFWCAFAITAVSYLAYLYFHSYPGLLSRDSMSTIRQILTGDYNNTMPFWHTITVSLFFNLGFVLFGEINAAVALYIGVQTIFLAACFAYVVVTLYQAGVPYVLVGLVFVGYTILPYHVAYSVTLWKDVLFGAAAVLLVTALYRILADIGKNKRNNILCLVVGAVGLSLWRTNGYYAMLATFLIMVLVLGKRYKRLLAILCGVLVFCGMLIGPVLTLMNVPGTDYVEALGIPFQQIARVVATDCPLTEEESQMLSQIFDLELVKEKYVPQTVDPIKFETFGNSDFLKEHLLQYMGLWLKLGLRYPGVYLQAWVESTKGYWNGGYEYWIYMYHMDENDLGIAASGGQNPIASVFRALFRFLEKPEILQPLYSIGLHVWLVVCGCFLCIKQKRKEFVITIPVLVIVAGLWIGTPVFAEFRYAYPVFTTVPLIVCATLFDRNQTTQ